MSCVKNIKSIPNYDKGINILYDENNNIINIPESIAIILDGNGRYAEKQGIGRALGHKAGCENLEIILEECVRIGVKFLTVYAFSTENWKRSKEEINALFELFLIYTKKIKDKAMKNDVRVKFIGDIKNIPDDLYKECTSITELTKNNKKSTFTIAFNYGSRDEIVRTIKKLNNNQFDFNNLTEEIITKNLDTFDIKDPDLLIRTSGEIRLSNFLLWQLAYTEIYITEVLWPEFSVDELYKAIINYNKRTRRFGGREKK